MKSARSLFIKPLRSGNQCMLVVPKIGTKRNGVQKNSYAEAVLWNYLHSTDLKRMETVFAFKSGLETLFFQTETRIINLFYVCVTTL